MHTHAFTYHRPRTLQEAIALHRASDNGSYVSGGHTLIPTMKNRLASPEALIDLRSVPDLHGIVVRDGRLVIGAATTHHAVSDSEVVRTAIPALAGLAGSIADVQVRHMGTIGGSIANNDPAADHPCAVLSLAASVETDRRTIAAEDFFVGLFTTALEPGEIVTRISFPLPSGAGYAKVCSQASRYAMAAAFVTVADSGVRVAVTGAGKDGVFRWTAAEDVLSQRFAPHSLAGLRPDEDAMLTDMHGAADYRSHLVGAVTRLAVESMGGACIL